MVAVLTLLGVVLVAAAVPLLLDRSARPAAPPTGALASTAATGPRSTASGPAAVVARGTGVAPATGAVGGVVSPPPPTGGASQPPQAAPTFVPLATAHPDPGIEATRIRIDRLGIDLPIVEGDGIDAPMFKAAHYPGTAWPRAGSNTYIYGHAQQKMFLPLWDARQGDEVVLDLVDGTQAVYVVDQVIPEAPWNQLSLLDPTPMEQLTLQTSTSNHETSPRFVVIAHPKS